MAETLSLEEMNAWPVGGSRDADILTLEEMNAQLAGPGDADVLSLDEMNQRPAGGATPETLTVEQMDRLSPPPYMPNPEAPPQQIPDRPDLSALPVGGNPEFLPSDAIAPPAVPSPLPPAAVPERPQFPGPTTTGGARRQLLEQMGVPVADDIINARKKALAIPIDRVVRLAFEGGPEWDAFDEGTKTRLWERVRLDSTAKAVEEYEAENPFLTRQGQRLKGGALLVGQAVQGMLALKNAEALNVMDSLDSGTPLNNVLFPGIDQPAPPTRPGMVPRAAPIKRLSGVMQTAATAYSAASPEEKAKIRQRYNEAFASQAGKIAEYAGESAKIPRNPAALAAMQAESVDEFLSFLWVDPLGVLGQIGVESLPASAPGLVLGTAGALAGGGPAGFAAGIGIGSGFVEFGASISQKLQDLGADLSDKESIRAVMRANADEIREFATTRGVAIGLFDAASGGLAATRLIPRPGGAASQAARMASNVGEAGAQLTAQGVAGGAGEAAGQIATGEELHPGEIGAEFVGEFVTGPVEVGGAVVSGARSKGQTAAPPGAPTPAHVDGADGGAPPGGTPQPPEGAPAPQETPAAPIPPETAPAATGASPVAPAPTAPPDNWPADVPRRVFHGSGRGEQGAAYAGPAVPILGPGRYAAFSEDAALTFGPEVEAGDVALRNPLVIRSDTEWIALTKEAGWRFPNPFGKSPEEVDRLTQSLQSLVRERGHDGVVVFWDDATTTDTDSAGNSIKTLRNVFSAPQVIEFGEGPTVQPAPVSESGNVPPEFTGPTDVAIPGPGTTGQPGQLGKAVARTENALANILTRADAKRNAPNLTKEQKAAAAQVKDEVIAGLEALESQAAAMQARDETGDLEFTVTRATGSQVTFTFPADAEAIAGVRQRLGKLGSETYFSQEQDTLPETAGMAPPGENYVGMVPDRMEGVSARDPLRRETILYPLLDALGVPLYQGRMKGRKILGFYRRNLEEVRIKNMNDIEVAAHELAHMLDDRFPEIRQQWLPASKANAAIRDELRGVSYDQSKLFEGFAEFVRLWATQKEAVQSRAPKFYAWFEGWLDRSEHGKALRRAQKDMHAWHAQDALTRARSKIGVGEDINAGLNTTRSKFRQEVADDLGGIYAMERDLTGGIASVGAYEKARTSRAAHSISEGVLLYGTLTVNPDGSHSFTGKSLQDILGPVADRIDDFILFAVGQSSNELMQQGRENLFTKAEIRAMLDLETAEFKTAFALYQEWNRGIVDFAQAKGLISPAFRSSWRRASYLPYHRVGQPGNFSAVTGDWTGIKALTGGDENLRNILQNMIGNATSLIQAALINEARLEVATLAKTRGGAHYMAEIPAEDKAVKIHREEIRRAILEAFGVKSVNELPPDIAVTIDRMIDGLSPMTSLLMRGQPPLGRNIVTILRRGRPEYYEVIDPLLYRAMVALKRKPRNRVLNFLSYTRRFQQSMITLTVNFVSKNLFRDTLMATVMSRHGFRPLIDSFKGLVSRVKRDSDYKDAIANGMGMASYLLDEDSYRAHMETFYSAKGFRKGSVLHGAKEMGFFLGRIADAVEMSARLGEYKRAIAKGEHPRHAAYSGREVSTDFAMRGDQETIQYLYDGAMFAKAAMNGIDRFYRGLAHDPNKVRIGVMTALFAAFVLANHIRNRDDDDIAEEYLELPDWELDFYVHFYIPNEAMLRHYAGLGEKPPAGERFHHFRLPAIWEVSAIANSVTRGYDGVVDEQPAEAAKHIGRIVKDQLTAGILPAAGEPIIESYFNYRFFTGRDIEPRGTQDLPPYMRATAGTSRIARELGEAQKNLPRELQLSPARIEALLDGYFHAWGTYGLTLADQLIYDDAPDMRFEDTPGLGVFYRPSPPGATKSQEQFYEFLREATEARNEIHDLAFRWRTDEAKAGAQEFWAQQYAPLSANQQAMGGLRKLRDRMLYAPDLASVHKTVADSMAGTETFGADVGKLYQGGNWHDLGALKKQIRNLITVKRNGLLRKAVRGVEARKKAAKP